MNFDANFGTVFKNTTAIYLFVYDRETQFLDRYFTDYHRKQDKEKEWSATSVFFPSFTRSTRFCFGFCFAMMRLNQHKCTANLCKKLTLFVCSKSAIKHMNSSTFVFIANEREKKKNMCANKKKEAQFFLCFCSDGRIKKLILLKSIKSGITAVSLAFNYRNHYNCLFYIYFIERHKKKSHKFVWEFPND